MDWGGAEDGAVQEEGRNSDNNISIRRGQSSTWVEHKIYIYRQEQFNVLQIVVDKSEEVMCLDIVQWLRDWDGNYLGGRRGRVPTDTSQDLQNILYHLRRRPDHLENVA